MIYSALCKFWFGKKLNCVLKLINAVLKSAKSLGTLL